MSSTSIPLAAISVAINILSLPNLKFFNVLVLWLWLLSPWIASTSIPEFLSLDASLLAPTFVLTNIIER